MNRNPTLVTAFYDIGRASWDKKGKSFARSRKTYILRFLRLCDLKNDIILFGEESFLLEVKRLVKSKKSNIKYVPYDAFKLNSERLAKIREIQKTKKFRDKVKKGVQNSPEYWDPKYVLVTNLKGFFLHESLKYTDSELIAWIDFGFARSYNCIPRVLTWAPIYSESKIHLMSLKEFDGKPLENCIFDNDVYISGELFYGNRDAIRRFFTVYSEIIKELEVKHIVDDDQGLLLGSYLKCIDLFVLNPIPNWQQNPKADVFSSLIKTDNNPSKVLYLVGLVMDLYNYFLFFTRLDYERQKNE